MKKFLAMLLAALLVVSMFSVAMADGEDKGTQVIVDGEVVYDSDNGSTEETTEEETTAEETTEEETTAEETTEEETTEEESTEEEPEVCPICGTALQDEKGNWLYQEKTIYLDPKHPCTSERAVVVYCPTPDCTYNFTVKAYDAVGHDLDYADTKTIDGVLYAKCKVCGEYVKVDKDTMKYGHSWDKGLVVREATCVSVGLKKFVCTDCGAIAIEEIDMLSAHKFDLKAANTYVIKRANCTQDGALQAVCTVCGGTYRWDLDQKRGVCVKVGWVEEFTYTYKYIDENGKEATKTVTVKPNYDNATASKLRGTGDLKIKARKHNWSLGVITKAPTCQKDGEAKFVCKNTDQTMYYDPCFAEEIRVLDHNETVFDARVQYWTSKYHNWIEKVEREPKDDPNGIGIHYYVCKTCGEITDETAFTAATIRYNGQYDAQKAGVVTGKPGTTPADTKPADNSSKKPSGSSTNKKGVSIPKTNDSTSNLPYVLIAVAFIGLVALVASKKKVHG